MVRQMETSYLTRVRVTYLCCMRAVHVSAEISHETGVGVSDVKNTNDHCLLWIYLESLGENFARSSGSLTQVLAYLPPLSSGQKLNELLYICALSL